MKASVGFAFFLLFLAGYALVTVRNMGKEAANSIPTTAELSANAWRPSQIGEITLAADTDLYVQFEPGGELGGHAGCNRFFGSYQLNGNMISIEPLGMTRMACPSQIMSLETAFIEALQSAKTIARAESRIALRNDQGRVTSRFNAIDRQDPR